MFSFGSQLVTLSVVEGFCLVINEMLKQVQHDTEINIRNQLQRKQRLR